MDEQLNNLLADAILAAMASRMDPKVAAENAARAFKAGQAAFREKATPAAARPEGQ